MNLDRQISTASGAELEDLVADASSPPNIQIHLRRLGQAESTDVTLKATDTVDDLKDLIQEQLGIPPKLQNLVMGKVPLTDGSKRASDCDITDGTTLTLLLIKEDPEKLMYTWDIANNPDKDMLIEEDDGCTVACPNMRTDYINVVSQK